MIVIAVACISVPVCIAVIIVMTCTVTWVPGWVYLVFRKQSIGNVSDACQIKRSWLDV
jgi:hypothetical protein